MTERDTYERLERRDEFEWLLRNACFSADRVAIGFVGTGADKTRAIIRQALLALLANGLITITPVAEWPEHYVADPPFDSTLGGGHRCD